VIPFNDLRRQHEDLRDELMGAMSAVYDRGWYVLGQEVATFEEEFSAYCDIACCVAMNSGTDALEIALRGVGVERGDLVATAANAGGYASCAIRSIGADPLYVDVQAADYCLSADELAAIIHQVKAVVVTHLYGSIAQVEPIVELACEHGVPVVEDCAHAHGARRKARSAGTFGDIGCFSFYPTKNLGAIGDGGAIVTGDPSLAARCRQLCQYGWSDRYNAVLPGGRNSRMDEIQATVLRVKLRHLDLWNDKRRQVARAYTEQLTGLHGISVPSRGTTQEDVVHLYVIEVDERDRLMASLKEEDVGSAIHYPVPDHHQPAFSVTAHSRRLPVTEKTSTRILSLPCYPEIQDAEIERVIDSVQRFR
jgi:dTDP-3-amino-2,3,6-trideoxy-4-keto-D-glucose/dTDP-3-amino-3,4,6-trideoxy-alpha-D-glucose/dTDP-2,6-dideoxy-D-kanosamine transaminase